MVTIGLILLSAVCVYLVVVAYIVFNRIHNPANDPTHGTNRTTTLIDQLRRERMFALILAFITSYIGYSYLHFRLYSVQAWVHSDEKLVEPLLVSYSVKSFGIVVHEKQAKVGENLHVEVETFQFLGRMGLLLVVVSIGIASYYAVRILLHRWRSVVSMVLPQLGNPQ